MPKISELSASTALTDDDYLLLVDDPAGTPATKRITAANAATYFGSAATEIMVALSDETTNLTTGTSKLTMRMPHGMTLTGVRSSLATSSSSGLVTVDINIDGDSILSTKLTIDATEKTSITAATAAVVSTADLWDDGEVTFDIDAAGTGAKGLKVTLIGERADIDPPSAGSITFVAATNTTYASRTDTTVTKPTGVADGDYILVGVLTGATGTAPDPTAPGGWTLLTGFPTTVLGGSFWVDMWVYGKVASSEGSSWTFTHTTCSSQGWAMAYRGVDTATPIDATPTTNTGTGVTTTATSITTVTANAMVVLAAHDFADTTNNLTPPTGTTPTFTERLDVTLSYVADGPLAAAGATGSKTMTNNSSSGNSWAAALIALRPA